MNIVTRFIIVITLQTFAALASTPVHLPNVDCAPYIDHVPTDPGKYRYEPYYVKLHRCHGKHPVVQNPKNEKCVPTSNGVQNVTIYAVNQLGKVTQINVVNHTACNQECVISQNDCSPFEYFKKSVCGCSCNYTSVTGPKKCELPLVWQQPSCNCVCPKNADSQVCGRRKEFNKDECGCTCKAKFYARCAKRKQVVDEDTCYCIEPSVIVGKSKSGCDGGVNGAMLAVVIIVEAFVIVFCYYFFYVYCYRHNYLERKNNKNVSSGYYHNGDIPNDTGHGNYGSAYDERNSYTESAQLTDKELIKQEERERGRLNGLSDKDRIRLEEENEYAGYYPVEEKSPLAPKHPPNGELYYDIMEVDGPPSSLDNHNLNIPPDYSDAVSDFSEDGYGSVTQV